MKILAFIFIYLSVFACRSNIKSESKNSIRDSIFKKHLAMIDTMPYYDTNNIDFKLIRAYSLNDTNTLENLQKHFEILNTKADWRLNIDSCISLPKFEMLKADEAYRFEYSSSLYCSYHTIITIVKNADSIKVNGLVYQPAFPFDSTPCILLEQKDATIDSLSWVKFQDALHNANFWGLKENDGHGGNDGSTLNAYGYQKAIDWRPERRSFVTRWSRSMDNLLGSFIMLLRFCKISKGCIRPG